MKTKTYHVKYYYTRILNNDSVFSGRTDYILGVIMGVMTSVCVEGADDDFLTKLSRKSVLILTDNRTGDRIYRIRTTRELYNKFADIIEKEYPGVCEFDMFD